MRDLICIRGSVTSGGDPVLGAVVEVLEPTTNVTLANLPTGADGLFQLDIDSRVDPDLVAMVEDRQLRVRVLDAANNEISSGRNVTAVIGDSVVDFRIGANRLKAADLLAENPRLDGPVLDLTQLDVIDNAIALIGPSDSAGLARWREVARCPLPPLAGVDNLVRTATEVLDGFPDATTHLRQALTDIGRFDASVAMERGQELLEAAGIGEVHFDRQAVLRSERPTLTRGSQAFAAPSSVAAIRSLTPDPGRIVSQPCVLPPSRIGPVLAATIQTAASRDDAAFLLGSLEMGLCGVTRLNDLIGEATQVLTGGPTDRFMGLMRGQFGLCGPDDGPIPEPFPDPSPSPEPWCPEPPGDFRLPDPCLTERLDCLREIVNSFRQPRSPDWRIDRLAPDQGCPDDLITLKGEYFGDQEGQVCFTAARSPQRRICVRAESWSDTRITVRVPEGATTGPVSLLVAGAKLSVCGSLLERTRPGTPAQFTSGVPAFSFVRVNGLRNDILVEPGEEVTVTWNATLGPPNTEVEIDIHNNLTRIARATNQPAAGSFTFTVPSNIRFERVLNIKLWARAALCPDEDCVELPALVTVVPELGIDGVEITQGIQTYGRPSVADNSLPTIAGKDTIVRVYVSSERNGFSDDLTEVTGTLTIDGTELTPINGITPTSSSGNPFIDARPAALIDREQTDHTLNFRVPADLSSGTKTMRIRVIGPEYRGSPLIERRNVNRTWQFEPALKVRFVRVRDGGSSGSDQRPTTTESRFTIARGFDLLPSPGTDVGPAATSTWNTTRDIGDDDGLSDLLGDLDDEHNCNAWEWLTQWFGSDCPNDDGAIWVGLTKPFNRGIAYRPGNTAMSAVYANGNGLSGSLRIKTGHEIGHNLSFRHVDRGCSGDPGGSFYDHPNDGELVDVPFDPYWNTAYAGSVGDFMSYDCTRYVSGDSWVRLRGQI